LTSFVPCSRLSSGIGPIPILSASSPGGTVLVGTCEAASIMSSDFSTFFSNVCAVPIHRPSPDGICGVNRDAPSNSLKMRHEARRVSPAHESFFFSAATSRSTGTARGSAGSASGARGSAALAEGRADGVGALSDLQAWTRRSSARAGVANRTRPLYPIKIRLVR
jgi:hypothetical protein